GSPDYRRADYPPHHKLLLDAHPNRCGRPVQPARRTPICTSAGIEPADGPDPSEAPAERDAPGRVSAEPTAVAGVVRPTTSDGAGTSASRMSRISPGPPAWTVRACFSA